MSDAVYMRKNSNANKRLSLLETARKKVRAAKEARTLAKYQIDEILELKPGRVVIVAARKAYADADRKVAKMVLKLGRIKETKK